MPKVCATCNESQDVPYGLSHWIEHVVSKNHQHLVKIKMNQWTKEETDRALVLGCIPAELNPQKILTTILNYGKVSDMYCHPQLRYCVVQMASRKIADNTLAQLQAKGHYVRKRSTLDDEEWELLNLELPQLNLELPFYRQHVNMFNVITNPSLDGQIREFFQRVTMKQNELNKRQLMLDQLETVLSFGTVYPFGSFLTGLSDVDSDVDVYFADGGTGDIDKKHILKTVCNAINRAKINNVKFGKVVKYLPHIRVPIVTFVHNVTKVHCDISIENMMAVQNSHLIKFYLSFHPVCRPLLILVRYWARFHNLVHDRGFKNYSISLLVIVSLVRKKILPSVELLQFLTAPVLINDTWNTAFCDDMEEVLPHMESDANSPTYNCPSDVLLFALDFFDMIANLTPNDVVCTLTGEFINNDLFEPGFEDQLPSCQGRYVGWTKGQTINSRFSLKSMIMVQDPFHLCHNTTANVNYATCNQLIQASKQTAARIRSNIHNRLVYLFFPIQEESKEKQQIKIKNVPTAAAAPVKILSNSEMNITQLQTQIQAYLSTKNDVEPPPRSSTLILSIDEEFVTLFMSNVKGLESLESILYSMYTLWFNFVRAFMDCVFKKVFDFEVRNRVNGSSERMAIILKEEDQICGVNGVNNPLPKSKKAKRKRKAAAEAAAKRLLSSYTPYGTNSSSTSAVQSGNVPLPTSYTSSTCNKRSGNDNDESVEDASKCEKMLKSSLTIPCTNHPGCFYNVEGFCSYGAVKSDGEEEESGGASVVTQMNSTVRLSDDSGQVGSGTMLSLKQSTVIERPKEKAFHHHGQQSVVLAQVLKLLDCRIVGKFHQPEKNPHVAKYKILSSQSRQRQLQSVIFECRGFYKFWIGREKITEEVMAEKEQYVRKTVIMNPMDVEKEICRRVLEQHGKGKAISGSSFDFACVVKEFIDTDLVKPQINVTFTELKVETSKKSFNNEKLAFTEYIGIMESIFKKSFADFIRFKLQSWLGVRVERNSPFQKR